MPWGPHGKTGMRLEGARSLAGYRPDQAAWDRARPRQAW